MHVLIKKIRVVACALAMSSTAAYGTDDVAIRFFVDSLMSEMTVEEKLGQLNLLNSGDFVTGLAKNSNLGVDVAAGRVGGVFNVKGVDKINDLQRLAVEESRLGIPLIFGMDVIHGYETIFPIPLAMSCSWDLAAIENAARISAKEASAAGISWTFSPMVDISRDPRWGRVSEGSGEDPFLGSAIARAMVKGYQGNDMTADDEIMACVKHFALYGAPEGGRDYNTVDMSRIRMYNEYLAPYKAAIDAGVGSVMSSFNTIDGIPATGNKWLLTNLLRDQWGFDGFVVTDYTAILEMIDHGMGDIEDVSALAINAGADMDMVTKGYVEHLPAALSDGKTDMAQIDKAVRRVLEAKYKLGLFDNPYKYGSKAKEESQIYTDDNKAAARQLATETFVLLKNEGNVLPLRKKGTIALIGPLADTPGNMPGTWSLTADPSKYKSLKQGFEQALKGKAKLLYAKGANVTVDPVLESNVSGPHNIRDARSEQEMLDEAIAIAKKSDVIVAALGETSEYSGESTSRTDLSLPATQMRLLQALVTTGKPVVLLNFAGRPTVMNWEAENVDAILNVWFGGSETAYAIPDVVFGDVAPSGKLTMSMPRSVGQIPLYYNCLNTGRPITDENGGFVKFRSNYLDAPNTPLFPFGYGLSYNDYNYSNLRLSSDTMPFDGSITVEVDVQNRGKQHGNEIVQMYIRDVVGSVSRPLRELKGFERVSLAPGEKKTVRFTITPELLKFYDTNLDYVCEPGEFKVMVGPNSRDVETLSFTLAKP